MTNSKVKTIMQYERLAELSFEMMDEMIQTMKFLEDRIATLESALWPLAEKNLYPDDIDEAYAAEVRADEDWDEERNDKQVDDCWIERGWVRAARAALGVK
jgi:hypothetical protein